MQQDRYLPEDRQRRGIEMTQVNQMFPVSKLFCNISVLQRNAKADSEHKASSYTLRVKEKYDTFQMDRTRWQSELKQTACEQVTYRKGRQLNKRQLLGHVLALSRWAIKHFVARDDLAILTRTLGGYHVGPGSRISMK